MMRVLVESRSLMNDLWSIEYEGDVVKETEHRYLIRHHLFLRSWVPKNGGLMRCYEVKDMKGEE